MRKLIGKQEPADALKHELGSATISLHTRPPDCHTRNAGHPLARVIPEYLLNAILEVIAKSIEQAMAGVMTNCVREGVETGIRPLIHEIALLRIAIEHDWDNDAQRRRGITLESEKEPKD